MILRVAEGAVNRFVRCEPKLDWRASGLCKRMGSRAACILLSSRRPPTVEIDTATGVAYIRFKQNETQVVHQRQVDRIGYPKVTLDYDKGGKLVGVEILGVVDFGVTRLLEVAQIKMPKADLTRARYVGSGHVELDWWPLANRRRIIGAGE